MKIINKNYWKIWNKKKKVEARTFDRTKEKLPEMESSKQLLKILKPIYKKNFKIMDVGCASGHYYHSIKKLNSKVEYLGIDATREYINFAKKYFKKNKSVNFKNLSIYNLKKTNLKSDIVYCCNLILHLPEIKEALKNLIRASKKYVIIRTLISSSSTISKRIISHKFNNNNEPINFVYQNTWSRNYIKSLTKKYKTIFIQDKFSSKNINKEYKKWNLKQGKDITLVKNGIQISGSKVFEWEWVLIIK